MSHVTICLSHSSHMTESCHTYERFMEPPMFNLYVTIALFFAWMSRGTRVDDSCHPCTWVEMNVWRIYVKQWIIHITSINWLTNVCVCICLLSICICTHNIYLLFFCIRRPSRAQQGLSCCGCRMLHTIQTRTEAHTHNRTYAHTHSTRTHMHTYFHFHTYTQWHTYTYTHTHTPICRHVPF